MNRPPDRGGQVHLAGRDDPHPAGLLEQSRLAAPADGRGAQVHEGEDPRRSARTASRQAATGRQPPRGPQPAPGGRGSRRTGPGPRDRVPDRTLAPGRHARIPVPPGPVIVAPERVEGPRAAPLRRPSLGRSSVSPSPSTGRAPPGSGASPTQAPARPGHPRHRVNEEQVRVETHRAGPSAWWRTAPRSARPVGRGSGALGILCRKAKRVSAAALGGKGQPAAPRPNRAWPGAAPADPASGPEVMPRAAQGVMGAQGNPECSGLPGVSSRAHGGPRCRLPSGDASGGVRRSPAPAWAGQVVRCRSTRWGYGGRPGSGGAEDG